LESAPCSLDGSSSVSFSTFPVDPFLSERSDSGVQGTGEIHESLALDHGGVGREEGNTFVIDQCKGKKKAIVGFQPIIDPMKFKCGLVVPLHIRDPLDIEIPSVLTESIELYHSTIEAFARHPSLPGDPCECFTDGYMRDL